MNAGASRISCFAAFELAMRRSGLGFLTFWYTQSLMISATFLRMSPSFVRTMNRHGSVLRWFGAHVAASMMSLSADSGTCSLVNSRMLRLVRIVSSTNFFSVCIRSFAALHFRITQAYLFEV